MYYGAILCREFTPMWRRMAFVITVVLLGLSGGVLALFVRGMHAERGINLQAESESEQESEPY